MNLKMTCENVSEKILVVLAIVMLAAMLIGMLGGCAPQAFRFAPTKAQTKAADATTRLAEGTAITGAKPFGPAGKALAKLAPTMQRYMGPTDDPMDIMPILEAEYHEWNTLEKQRDGFKFISKLAIISAQKVTDKLRDLIVRVGESEDQNISVQDLVPALTALADSQAIILDAANTYEIPDDWQANEDIKELIAKIEGVVNSANIAAAKRPTGTDIVNEGIRQVNATNESAKDIASTANDILAQWGLPGGLASILGVGGIFGLRGRKKRKVAEGDVETKATEIMDLKDKLIATIAERDTLKDQNILLAQKVAESPSSLAT